MSTPTPTPTPRTRSFLAPSPSVSWSSSTPTSTLSSTSTSTLTATPTATPSPLLVSKKNANGNISSTTMMTMTTTGTSTSTTATIPKTNSNDGVVRQQQQHPKHGSVLVDVVNDENSFGNNSTSSNKQHTSSASASTSACLTCTLYTRITCNKRRILMRKYGIVRFILLCIPFLLSFRYVRQMVSSSAIIRLATMTPPTEILLTRTENNSTSTSSTPAGVETTTATGVSSGTKNDIKKEEKYNEMNIVVKDDTMVAPRMEVEENKGTIHVDTSNSTYSVVEVVSNNFNSATNGTEEAMQQQQQQQEQQQQQMQANIMEISANVNNTTDNNTSAHEEQLLSNNNTFVDNSPLATEQEQQEQQEQEQQLPEQPNNKRKVAVAYIISPDYSTSTSTNTTEDNNEDGIKKNSSKIYDNYFHHLLYNILINTEIMRSVNSTVDVVVLIRINNPSKDDTRKDNTSTSTGIDDDMDDDDDIVLEYLPADIIHLLENKNIKYRYITNNDDMYDYGIIIPSIYDPFRLLKLKQYERIVVLDSSKVLLRSSIDYIFDWSLNSSTETISTNPLNDTVVSPSSSSSSSIQLMKNLILMSRTSNSSTTTTLNESNEANKKDQNRMKLDSSFFMLSPDEMKWDQFVNLIIKKNTTNDDAMMIVSIPDEILETIPKAIDSSTYVDVDSDIQSSMSCCWTDFDKVLYYWTMYVEKSVSIVIDTTIYNWENAQSLSTSSSDSFIQPQTQLLHVQLKETINVIGKTITTSRYTQCWTGYDIVPNIPNNCTLVLPLYSDFIYFNTNAMKPWVQGPTPNVLNTNNDNNESQTNNESSQHESPTHYWFSRLAEINTKYNIGIDFNFWNSPTNPSWTAPEPTIVYKPSSASLLSLYRPIRKLSLVTPLSSSHEDEKSNYNDVNGTTTGDDVSTTTGKMKKKARFAYAYVVGGCNPDSPSYRNYFYDIMISTYLQRMENSTADVIVFVQMAHKSQYTALPDIDRALLRSMKIQLHYIPKAHDESFYRIMLDKFRILELTRYDRVMFLDSDIMTVGSLDYIFELSMAGVLKRNVVFSGKVEPANGGTFMLAPQEGKHDQLLRVIQDKEVRGMKLEYPHWDDTVGWGKVLDGENDYYQILSDRTKRTMWNFHGAFTDQGLLYHWVKFEDQDVSIIYHDEIQNWGLDVNNDNSNNSNSTNDTPDVILQETLDLRIVTDSVNAIKRPCFDGFKKNCMPPHSDFIHFTGTKKPWLAGPPENAEDYKQVRYDSATLYWFHILDKINEDLNLGIDFANWERRKRPSLGLYPKFVDAVGTTYRNSIRRRKRQRRRLSFQQEQYKTSTNDYYSTYYSV